ncbi:MAG: polyprenyl synthetase family protein [Dehalococcoidales bacterium]
MTLPEVAGFYDMVREPLTRVRRGLAAKTTYDRPWPLLPLMICEAISGHYEYALPAAASLQLLTAAADVFDDIEDADSSESLPARYGSGVATNVATTLLMLAERAITRLKGRGVADDIILRVIDAVNSFYTTACAGQHLDLSLTPETTVSEDRYLTVAYMKSASTVECTCHVAALLATANRGLIDIFTKFGNNLGMASQIANDIHGITHESEIFKRKMTIPVIYALAQTDSEIRNYLESVFRNQSEVVPDTRQIRDLLFRTGAIHYATVKMEFYRQRALDNLSEAEVAGANMERLKLFLGISPTRSI